MDKHIFDILGVGSREDSYTDLLGHAFNENSTFKKNFLSLLGEKDDNDWEYEIRPNIPIKSESGRKKDIPDLILYNKKTKVVLLIENKIFSDEGWNQTERYASEEFKDSIEEYLDLQKPHFKFFYLTLDGTKPSSKEFQILTYKDISNAIPTSLGNTKLDILLKELKERIDEYYNWPKPKDDYEVLEYLKNTQRLVNPFRTFQILANNLIEPDTFLTEFGITANRGSGYIPICLWYKKTWKSNPEEKDGGKCYNIHFEFQWDTKYNSLRLYLHYETNPYMTQKEFKTLDEDFQKEYKKSRDDFFYYVKEKKPKSWKIKKTYLGIAYYPFDDKKDNDDKGIEFGEMKKIFQELFGNMTPIIDKYLNTKKIERN